MGLAARTSVDAVAGPGARLRRGPLPRCGELWGGGDVADPRLSRVAERAPVRTLRLRALGDRRGDATAGNTVPSCRRSRADRSLGRPAGRPPRLPSPRWRGWPVAKRARALRR